MPIFGADISSYEHGLRIADLTDCAFVFAKATEGTYYVDADYDSWRQQAKAAGKLFVPYHFISGEDPALQAGALLAHIGDTSLPVMLDWEPAGSYSPTLAQLYAVADAMAARGLRVRLAYMPRWFWAQLGGPDLSGLTARRLGMISSAYPGGSGTAAQLYPGDGVASWQPYGGVPPLLYQFTNQASDGGQLIDMNAYKGTAVALAAFLGQPTPTPPAGGAMPTIPDSIASQDPDLPQIPSMFPAGSTFDPNGALIWTDERAAAANLHARQARDAVTALAQKVAADDADAAAHLQQLADSVAALIASVHELASVVPTGVVSQVDPAAYAAVLAPPLVAELARRLTLTVGAR